MEDADADVLGHLIDVHRRHANRPSKIGAEVQCMAVGVFA